MKQFSKLTLFLIALTIWMGFSIHGAGMAFIGLIIAVAFYWFFTKDSSGNKKVKDEDQRKEAQLLIETITNEKKLTPISSSLLLENEEYAFLTDETALFETRAVRTSSGGGVGVRIAKGIGVGGYQGRSESHQELKQIDTGTITVTNKRIIFRGSQENRVVPISKIVELKLHADGIELASTGKQKSSIFTVSNPYLWHIYVFVLSKVKDPLDFSEVKNIDITIS